MAARFQLEHLAATQAEVGQHVGRSPRRLREVIKSGEFDKAIDLEARGLNHQLVGAARAGLLRAWSKGTGTEAARKVLVSRGILEPDQLRLSGKEGGPIEIDSPELNAAIKELLARSGDEVG